MPHLVVLAEVFPIPAALAYLLLAVRVARRIGASCPS